MVTTLQATAEDLPNLVAIHAGGSAFGQFQADTADDPSKYLVSGQADEAIERTGVTVDTSNPTVPGDIPPSFFNSERWNSDGQLKYSVPMAAGLTVVALFFDETYGPTQITGGRLMDVYINGTAYMRNLDIFNEVGADAAVVKTFLVTSSGTINVNIVGTAQFPHLNGLVVAHLGDNLSARIQLTPLRRPPTRPRR